MFEFLRAGGFAMVPVGVIGIAMLVTGVLFARNADPRRLSLVRALTWAIVLAMVLGVASGLAATAHFVVEHDEAAKEPLPYLLQGFAETMSVVVLGGALSSLTWVLVAVGVRRMPREPL